MAEDLRRTVVVRLALQDEGDADRLEAVFDAFRHGKQLAATSAGKLA